MKYLAMLLAVLAQAQSGAGVEGKVIDGVTGQPLARAEVVLQGESDAYVKETDTSGRFRVADMVPGTYAAHVQHARYTAVPRGVSEAKATPRFTVAAGEQIRNLTLRLIPLGAISGRIVNADGDPVSKILVEAVGYSYSAGRKKSTAFGSAMSDDRGEFRVAGCRRAGISCLHPKV